MRDLIDLIDEIKKTKHVYVKLAYKIKDFVTVNKLKKKMEEKIEVLKDIFYGTEVEEEPDNWYVFNPADFGPYDSEGKEVEEEPWCNNPADFGPYGYKKFDENVKALLAAEMEDSTLNRQVQHIEGNLKVCKDKHLLATRKLDEAATAAEDSDRMRMVFESKAQRDEE